MTDADKIEDNKSSKKPVTKEKLRSIMEAASALTALGDEESDEGRPGTPPNDDKKEIEGTKTEGKVDAPKSAEMSDMKEEDASKRYLPDHKKPDAAPTFPEKLMNLMRYANEQGKGFCVEWLGDGRSFVINDPEKFTRNVVPKFFKQTKFSSFTRKLYRWGFRQVNRGIGPDDPIIFGNEFFQRDNAEVMAKMRSITAATSRKQDQHQMPSYAMKRPFDGPMDENMHKRMMFDHYLQNKANHYMHNPAAMYAGMHGGMQEGESLSLTNALYPNMGMGGGHSQNMMGMHGNNGHGYDLMKGNGMMNQYVPHHQNMQAQQQGQYQNQSSTAEIVNAAISALRYAN